LSFRAHRERSFSSLEAALFKLSHYQRLARLDGGRGNQVVQD
jgi:hypothetical protein